MSCQSAVRLDMPADLRRGLHCVWYYELQCWCAECGIVLAKTMRRIGSSHKRCCGRVYIQPGIGRNMPAIMRCGVHSVGGDKLQCWCAERSNLCTNIDTNTNTNARGMPGDLLRVQRMGWFYIEHLRLLGAAGLQLQHIGEREQL